MREIWIQKKKESEIEYKIEKYTFKMLMSRKILTLAREREETIWVKRVRKYLEKKINH